MANPEHVAILKQGVEAWNAWRERNPTMRPDLSRADLTRCRFGSGETFDLHLGAEHLGRRILFEEPWQRTNFRDVNFVGALFYSGDLHNADFTGASLTSAILNRADLHGAVVAKADLERASLRETNLTNTDLADADLTDSRLDGAVVSGSCLDGTRFRSARFGGTTFSNLDLSAADLNNARHSMPSTIGIDTICRSKGKIPLEFLRGCGIPESFIVFACSLLEHPVQFYSCFISYSHTNKAFARKLHDALQRRGIRCWLDEKQLLPGQDIYDEVDRGIRLWDKVLLCCSEASLTSWWVDSEIGTAFEKEQQLTRERGAKVHTIIPLDLDGYLFRDDWKSGYRAQIRRHLAADFTGWETDAGKFDAQVGNIILALRAGESAREQPPKSTL